MEKGTIYSFDCRGDNVNHEKTLDEYQVLSSCRLADVKPHFRSLMRNTGSGPNACFRHPRPWFATTQTNPLWEKARRDNGVLYIGVNIFFIDLRHIEDFSNTSTALFLLHLSILRIIKLALPSEGRYEVPLVATCGDECRAVASA
jgi:hypothetical protein